MVLKTEAVAWEIPNKLLEKIQNSLPVWIPVKKIEKGEEFSIPEE